MFFIHFGLYYKLGSIISKERVISKVLELSISSDYMICIIIYADSELVLGKNILNASTELDFSEIYSEYRVLGQTSKTIHIN